ncbi:MAG: hypothetical protein EA380_10335 [Phycisphaeraceae bacterium]|nr:MAG: hypothetical protein EA380_10335 [Phycisphaeraceae bacterium]
MTPHSITTYRVLVVDALAEIEGEIYVDAESQDDAIRQCSEKGLVTGPVELASTHEIPVPFLFYRVLEVVDEGYGAVADVQDALDESNQAIHQAVEGLIAAGYLERDLVEALLDAEDIDDLRDEAKSLGLSTKGGQKAIVRRLIEESWSEKEKRDRTEDLDCLQLTQLGQKVLTIAQAPRTAYRHHNEEFEERRRLAREQAEIRQQEIAEEEKTKQKAKRKQQRQDAVQNAKDKTREMWAKFNRWLGDE